MVGDVDVFYVYMGVNVVNLSRIYVIIFDVVIINESDGYILNLGGFIVFMNGVYNFNWNVIVYENNNIFIEIIYFIMYGKCVCVSVERRYCKFL